MVCHGSPGIAVLVATAFSARRSRRNICDGPTGGLAPMGCRVCSAHPRYRANCNRSPANSLFPPPQLGGKVHRHGGVAPHLLSRDRCSSPVQTGPGALPRRFARSPGHRDRQPTWGTADRRTASPGHIGGSADPSRSLRQLPCQHAARLGGFAAPGLPRAGAGLDRRCIIGEHDEPIAVEQPQ